MQATAICPRCLSTHSHRSAPKSRVERVLSWIGLSAWRCGQCYRRYWF